MRIGRVSQPAADRPGRYQRSTGGLIGALVITLLVIGAFVAFRAVNRTELEVHPDPVDYRAAVVAVQEAGKRPVYPETLPAGWIATSVDIPRGEDLDWGMGMLTGDGRFVGLRQSPDSVTDLVEEYVDQDATEGEPTDLPGSLVTTWRSFGDTGGDRAYAAEIDGATVLVYGSAPDADLQAVIAALSTASA